MTPMLLRDSTSRLMRTAEKFVARVPDTASLPPWMSITPML